MDLQLFVNLAVWMHNKKNILYIKLCVEYVLDK